MEINKINLDDIKIIRKNKLIGMLSLPLSFLVLFLVLLTVGIIFNYRSGYFLIGGIVFIFLVALGISFIIMRKYEWDLIEKENVKKLIASSILEKEREGFQIDAKIESNNNFNKLFINGKERRAIYFAYLDKKYTFMVINFTFDEINKINIEIEPKQLEKDLSGSSIYTMGGAMVGGLTGLIAGTIIDELVDTLKGPQKIYFGLSFTFIPDKGKKFNFTPISTTFGINPNDRKSFEDFVKKIDGEMINYLETIKIYFQDKI